MTLHIISDALQQRVTAHLSQFGTLARSVLWTGRGSIVAHFVEPITTSATDQRFAPLTVNWSATFRSPDGAIYLNVPASWRKADREAGEGEANVTTELTPLMVILLKHLASGFVALQHSCQIVDSDTFAVAGGFAKNSLTGLIKRGLVSEDTDVSGRWLINDAGRAVINRPIADPTAPIPVNEIENLDEPHSDIGTLVSDEAPLTVPDQAIVEAAKPIDPYAWATPERRAEVAPIIEKLMPIDLYPSKTEGVWQIEDAVTERTMRRGLSKFNVVNLSVEEDEMDGEPYTIARFSIGKALDAPYPSKRPSKPAADAPSIHAQYDALHDTLPAATQLLIQLNGDEWLAFQMDAMLLRRYAPLCRFTAQTINQAGEQWDKLVIPAGVLDELVTLANEGGLTVALASIVRDEPNTLPVREVTEIHRPNEPVQYLGKEEPPTEWETEADEEAKRELHLTPGTGVLHPMMAEAAPNAEPKKLRVEAPKLAMTPELNAAKIRLHIHGTLRLGRLGIVRQLDRHELPGQWFDVFFVHPVKPYIVEALEADYDIEQTSGHIVTLRPKTAAPLGDVQAQADAVVNALPDLTPAIDAVNTLAAALSDAQARVDEFVAAKQAVDGPALLDETDERDLIAALKLEHADIDAATFGITHFLLNVIARMRTTATVAAPF